MEQTSTVFYGTIVHSLSPQTLEHVCNAVIVVDNSTGVITHIERDVQHLESFLKQANLTEAKARKKNIIRHPLLNMSSLDSYPSS